MKLPIPFVVLCLLCTHAIAATETLVPLPGWMVGRISGTTLKCFDLNIEQAPKWQPCPQAFQITLPSDTLRVLGNERTFAFLSAKRADFYDEAGKLTPRRQIEFPHPIKPETFFNGMASTEPELARIDQGKLVITNSADPASQLDAPIDCPSAIGAKAYAYGWNTFAFVSEKKVTMRDLRRAGDKRSPRFVCVPSIHVDFDIPADAEEVFFYRYEFIGVRKARRVEFFALEPKTGWVRANTSTRGPGKQIPDLDLP